MGGVDTAPEMERMTDMRVYADQAATTSLSKTALEAMLPWMTENFGNPSALYEEGRTARDAVETAREKIAHLLHARAKEIYFTHENSTKAPFPQEALDAWKNHTNPVLYPDVDWVDKLLRKSAPQQQYNP